jgi:predicted HAD superfamily Cof-like phosphohydrolase
MNIAGMVKHYYERAEIVPKPEMAEGLIDEEYAEWSFESNLKSAEVRGHFYQDYSPANELKELSDLVYVIYGYAQSRGWDLDKSVFRVHSNNMNRMFQDDGTLKRNEAGKILKNPNTPKVVLEDLV